MGRRGVFFNSFFVLICIKSSVAKKELMIATPPTKKNNKQSYKHYCNIKKDDFHLGG